MIGSEQTRRQVLRGGVLAGGGWFLWDWISSTNRESSPATTSSENQSLPGQVSDTPATVAPVEDLAITSKPPIDQPAAHLPQAADVVFTVDVASILRDRRLRRIFNAVLIERADGADQLSDVVTDPTQPMNLTAVRDVAGYLNYVDGDLEGGVMINAEASVAEARNALEDSVRRRGSYRGVNLFTLRPRALVEDIQADVSGSTSVTIDTDRTTVSRRSLDQLWVALLRDGRFLVGTKPGVTRLIDVDIEDESASIVGTPLAGELTSTAAAIRIAGRIDREDLPPKEQLGRLYPIVSRMNRFGVHIDRREQRLVADSRVLMDTADGAESLYDILRSARQDVDAIDISSSVDGPTLSVTASRSIEKIITSLRSSSSGTAITITVGK